MQKTPSVCIMIPTYNQAAFVTKAIESALAQNYPNLEVIVSDDGSTDNTEAVIQPYLQNKLFRYKKNSSNIGRVANYKYCLYNHVKADWVINLDGDDYYTNPNFIAQAMRSILEVGEKNVLLYQGVHIRKLKHTEELHTLKRAADKAILKAVDYFFDTNWHMSFSHMSTIYNRELAIKSGFYELNILSTDIYSTLKLCLNNPDKKVILSKKVSGKWVQHVLNASKSASLTSHLNNAKAYKALYLVAVKNGFDLKQCNSWLYSCNYRYFRYYLGLLVRKLAR